VAYIVAAAELKEDPPSRKRGRGPASTDWATDSGEQGGILENARRTRGAHGRQKFYPRPEETLAPIAEEK
jgi:hypothetical protein